MVPELPGVVLARISLRESAAKPGKAQCLLRRSLAGSLTYSPKSILDILTVCLRVLLSLCLAESTLTYPQHFPTFRDDSGEKCGLAGHHFSALI